jgi:hypothetical protein
MYIGFGNGKLGVWIILTPIFTDILKEKIVIFQFEKIMLNC